MHHVRVGDDVILRAPRALRGTHAVVRRLVPGGWEVEVRSAAGTPLHLVLATRRLRHPARHRRGG